jgi:hypothetical protein
MFFQTVFTSLLIILLGLGLTFAGYRFFVILVSIWGFFAGSTSAPRSSVTGLGRGS